MDDAPTLAELRAWRRQAEYMARRSGRDGWYGWRTMADRLAEDIRQHEAAD